MSKDIIGKNKATDAPNDKFIGPNEASRILGVGPTTIQRWIDGGFIPAHRTQGGHRRIRITDLAEYANQHGLPIDPNITTAPGNRCLLVVDDDRDILDAVALRIRGTKPDIDVITVDSAFKAGFLIYRFRPLLVLLDIRMPALSGIEVCRIIKAEPSTSHTRIVGITASRAPGEIRALLEAGAEEVIEKPFDWDVLMAAVDRYLPPSRVQAGSVSNEERRRHATG